MDAEEKKALLGSLIAQGLAFKVICERCERETTIATSNALEIHELHCTSCGSTTFKRFPL